MRTVFFLVQKEFLQVFRNRFMLPLILVMPIVQTVLLSFAANYEVKNLSLGVVDHDLSPMSRQLVARFSASGYFKLANTSFTVKEADADLARDRTDLILEIPPHFERNFIREAGTSVSITANAINAVKAGLGIGYANSIVQAFAFDQMPGGGAGAQIAPAQIKVAYSNWYNPDLDYKTFMVPGILSAIVSLVIGFLTALNIVRERELGTIEQLNVTPIKKWQFILGKLMPFWLISLVIMTVGLTVGWLVFPDSDARTPVVGICLHPGVHPLYAGHWPADLQLCRIATPGTLYRLVFPDHFHPDVRLVHPNRQHARVGPVDQHAQPGQILC